MPKRIKYICVRCGKCCFRWPFQINLDDFKGSGTEEHYKSLIAEKVEGVKLGEVTKVELVLYTACIHYNPKTHLCKIYDKRYPKCRGYVCGEYCRVKAD